MAQSQPLHNYNPYRKRQREDDAPGGPIREYTTILPVSFLRFQGLTLSLSFHFFIDTLWYRIYVERCLYPHHSGSTNDLPKMSLIIQRRLRWSTPDIRRTVLSRFSFANIFDRVCPLSSGTWTSHSGLMVVGLLRTITTSTSAVPSLSWSIDLGNILFLLVPGFHLSQLTSPSLASYRSMLLKYTLIVTLPSLLSLVFFAILKITVWPHSISPSPIREILTAAAAWTVGFALRLPLFYLATLFHTYVNRFTIVLSTFFQVLSEELLRLGVLLLLGIQLERRREEDGAGGWEGMWMDTWDPAFTRVWWIAMGWAAADVVVGLTQGYDQLSLYKDVLPPYSSPSPHESPSLSVRHSPTRAGKQPLRASISTTTDPHSHSTPSTVVHSIQLSQDILTPDLESQISHLLALKTRAEIEDVYGSPLPNIPLFLMFLQRLDAVLLSLGLTLVLSAAYLSACVDEAPTPVVSAVAMARAGGGEGPTWAQVKAVAPTFLALVGVHFALGAIWTAGALPRIGMHTASYVGLLVSLGCFFAGLGGWGALV